jgi:phenylacetate-CoA ligase
VPDDIRSTRQLSLVPVITKRDLRVHFPHQVVADNLPPERRRPATTSGSSGVPFEFFTDAAARDLHAASLDFYRTLAGITPADSPVAITSPRDQPQVQLLQERLRRLLTGSRSSYISIFDATMARLNAVLQHVSSYYLHGYPSYIARLAREIEAYGIRLRNYPKVVITDSETLTPLEAEQIGRAFRCPTVNHYESFEFGSIAQSCPDNSQVLHVNSESVLVEVVGDDGYPISVGGRGRVVITDLHNYVMPFIRYDIGDTAVAGRACSCGRGLPTLERLEGRTTEHIRTPGGRVITSGILGTLLFVRQSFLPYVAEYQAIQTRPDTVVLKLVPTARFDHDTGATLHTALRALLGDDMHVKLDLVDQIPREASGKRLVIKSLVAARS